MGRVAVEAIAKGCLRLARPGFRVAGAEGGKLRADASRGSVRAAGRARTAGARRRQPRRAVRWAGHPRLRTTFRRSARDRGLSRPHDVRPAARHRPRRGSPDQGQDAPILPRRSGRRCLAHLPRARSPIRRWRQTAALRPARGRSGASPAPGRLAPSDRTRRQPRAPGRPVNRPSMCRVIWCSRPPRRGDARYRGASPRPPATRRGPARHPRAHRPRSATEPGS